MQREIVVKGIGVVTLEVNVDWSGDASLSWVSPEGLPRTVELPAPLLRAICRQVGSEMLNEGLDRLLNSLDGQGIC